MTDAPTLKTAGDDEEARTHRSLTNQKRAGERTPGLDTWFSLRRGQRGFAAASRPPTARRGRQTTMHEIGDPTDEQSSQINPGCHGCHTPVTAAAVTPSAAVQAFYLPARWGVTAVTADSSLIAHTQARARAPAPACITRLTAVTAVTPPLSGRVTAAPGRKGVTPPGVTPRDPAVTPPRWSA